MGSRANHPQLRLTRMQDQIVRQVAHEFELTQAGAIRRLAALALGWGESAILSMEQEIEEARRGHIQAAGAGRVEQRYEDMQRSGLISAARGSWQSIRRVVLPRPMYLALDTYAAEQGNPVKRGRPASKVFHEAFLDGVGRWMLGERPAPGLGTFAIVKAQMKQADQGGGLGLSPG